MSKKLLEAIPLLAFLLIGFSAATVQATQPARVAAQYIYGNKCEKFFNGAKQIRRIRKPLSCRVSFALLVNFPKGSERVPPHLLPTWTYSVTLIRRSQNGPNISTIAVGETDKFARGVFKVNLNPTRDAKVYEFQIYAEPWGNSPNIPKGYVCTLEYEPVCGIGLDNKFHTYGNSCEATVNEARNIVPFEGSDCDNYSTMESHQ